MNIEPVHFKSTGESITAMLSSDIHAQFVPYAVGAPQVKVRAVASTGPVRSPAFADVATFKELEDAGLRVTATTRAEFARQIKDDTARWGNGCGQRVSRRGSSCVASVHLRKRRVSDNLEQP